MNVTMKRSLPPITLPDAIKRGELVTFQGQPYVIESVTRINEPWTHRPALRCDIAENHSIVFLILTCSVCDERAAMQYGYPMKETEWTEVRWKGEYYWLCPTHAAPTTTLLKGD